MHKIMIIRHAEKHQHGSHGHGVTEDGRPARHELTVRGWQRAAALVHLFAPPGAVPNGLADPDAPVDLRLERDQAKPQPAGDAHRRPAGGRARHFRSITIMRKTKKRRLQPPRLAAPSPVLIVWHHGHIARLAREIAGEQICCPAHWPDDRFDVVWILERSGAHGGAWSFSQVAQCLLPDDCPDVF